MNNKINMMINSNLKLFEKFQITGYTINKGDVGDQGTEGEKGEQGINGKFKI